MKRGINLIGVICLVIVTVLNILYTANLDASEHITITNNTFIYIIGIIALGVLIIFLTNIIEKKLFIQEAEEKSRKKFFIITILIYAILNIIWIVLVRPPIVGDQIHVCNLAQTFYNNNLEEFLPNMTYAGIPLSKYMQAYHQQISLAFVFSIFFRIIHFDTIEILRVLNVIGNIMIFIAIYKIGMQLSKKYTINKTRLVFFIFTFASLPMLSTFIYGDIPSLALCLFSTYFMMRYTELKKVKYPVWASVFTMLAYMMRMNSLIFIIATVIYLVFNLFKDITAKTWKENILNVIVIIMYVAISIIPSSLVQNYYLDKYNMDKNAEYPTISYFLMAMEESWRGNGWYSEERGEYALKSTEKAEVEYVDEIKNRLEYFAENKGYAVDFYVKKLASMWAENTYSAIRLNIVQENDTIESLTQPLTFYQKTLLVVMCACSCIFLIQNRKNISLDVIFLIIIFIGGFTFHVLWEAKSRYIIPYIVVLIPVASMKIENELRKLFVNRSKKKIIIAISTLIIVIMIIAGLVVCVQTTTDKQVMQTEEEGIPGVNIYDTYSENALIFTEIELKTDNDAEENIGSYVQVSGLKDKNIQNSINGEIEDIAMNFYSKHRNDADCWFFASVQANFANVLSITVDYYENEESYIIGLNYNLITGEKLELKDLFTSDSDGKTVVRKAAYEDLIWSYSIPTDEGVASLMADDYGEIEDEILEIMYAYNSNKLTNFYFTTRIIGIVYNDEGYMFFINMADYAEYIGIYGRYVDVSNTDIYEEADIAKTGLYCMTYRQETFYEILEEADNYYIDLNIIKYDEQTYPDEVINRAKEIIDKKYEEIQSLNIEENEFYIFNMVLQVSYGTEDDETIYLVDANYYSYVTTIALWNNTYKKELIQDWRYTEEGGDAYSNITNYVNTSLDVKETEEYSVVLTASGEDRVLSTDKAIEIVEEIASNFVCLEQEWEEELEEYGELYYAGLERYFTEKGVKLYKENAKDYFWEIVTTDEDGFDTSYYNFIPQDSYQFGNQDLYMGIEEGSTEIKSVSANKIEAVITLPYITEDGMNLEYYKLTMEILRGFGVEWYINSYSISID